MPDDISKALVRIAERQQVLEVKAKEVREETRDLVEKVRRPLVGGAPGAA